MATTHARHARPTKLWCKILGHTWINNVTYDKYTGVTYTSHYHCDRCKEVWS